MADVSQSLLIAGDFSGIQDYVLAVSAAGKGQARRLRARSFFVQLLGEVVTWKVIRAFGGDWSDVLIAGGGQFLIRARSEPGAERRLAVLRESLTGALYRETNGELALSMTWGHSIGEVLRRKEAEKRRPWSVLMSSTDGWRTDRMSMPELGDPCEICQRRRASAPHVEHGETIQCCDRCAEDLDLGKLLPTVGRVGLGDQGGRIRVLGAGVFFDPGVSAEAQTTLIPRPLHRHIPIDGMTFEQIADRSRGDRILGVLKADVDSMGRKVAEIAGKDPSLGELGRFSAALDDFFGVRLQAKLSAAGSRYSSIYTVYSGGDDLLLIGPWDLILDFAGEVRKGFQEGSGGVYGLTLSAGISFTRPKVPVREAVERADELLDLAKTGPKDQCASLGEVWNWSRHSAIVSRGKEIGNWIDLKVCGRSLIHRLLRLAELREVDHPGRRDPKAVVLWAWELGRNFPPQRSANAEQSAMRAWGQNMLGCWSSGDETALSDLCASLRYALTATRSRRD